MNNSSKRFSFLFTFLLMIAAMLVVSSLMNSKRGDEITYSEMRTLFLEEKVESFVWEDGELTLTVRTDNGPVELRHELASVDIFVDDLSGVYERQQREGQQHRQADQPVRQQHPVQLQRVPGKTELHRARVHAAQAERHHRHERPQVQQ